MYNLKYTPEAERDIMRLKKAGNKPVLRKLNILLNELTEHPYSGTGKVERLKHYEEATWSRRITDKHRLVYRVYNNIVEVLIISAYGHYYDK